MPTPTLKQQAPVVYANVPVDNFTIVNGPSAGLCFEAYDRLNNGHEYVELEFTLKTPASRLAFRRKIKVYTIFDVRWTGNEFTFTALFSGSVVSGFYNIQTRSGWFNLD